MDIEFIEKEYQRLTLDAEEAWRRDSTTGSFLGLPDGYFKLGICVGSYFRPGSALTTLLDRLELISREDKALTLVPRASQHFTFLALAGHRWAGLNELPSEISELKEIVGWETKDLIWRLGKLRIVPGRNFLLLAGIPDREAFQSRQNLAEKIMATSWKTQIQERYEYKGFPFPPTIWHTTLCRYQRERLPIELRELFAEYRAARFEEIELESPKLRAISYDWSIASEI